MRLLLISDVHGNWEALNTVIQNESYDMIISAGDTVDLGPNPRKCIEFFKKNNVLTVLGNHDWAVINEGDPGSINKMWESICRKSGDFTRKDLGEANINYIRQFSLERYEKINGKIFYIVHGGPSNPLGKYIEPELSDEQIEKEFRGIDADYIVLGHTHFPMIRRIKNKVIINPGSIGQPKDGNNFSSYAVFENGIVTLKRSKYNIKAVIERYRKWDLDDIEREQLELMLTTAIQPSMPLKQGIDRPDIKIKI